MSGRTTAFEIETFESVERDRQAFWDWLNDLPVPAQAIALRAISGLLYGSPTVEDVTHPATGRTMKRYTFTAPAD